jgi:tetratricopeptide (TPR) repeat protein
MNTFHQIPLEAITLYRQALEMSGRGNHESALKYLSTAVTIAPQFASAICEMGHCYEKLGRFPEAVSKFDKVLKIHPTHVEAEVNKNRVMEKMGRKNSQKDCRDYDLETPLRRILQEEV